MDQNPHEDEVKLKYKKYIDDLNKEWAFVREAKDNLALCIGAGVTSFFVGEWGKLLSKLANLRVGDTLAQQWVHEDALTNPNISELESYINNMDGFFPKDIDVLEQGEYLLEDKYDFSFTLDSNSENENKFETIKEKNWKESFFAEQVNYVIEQTLNEKIQTEKLGAYFINHKLNKKMATLRQVISICLKLNIEYVVNYNFDTILDKLLLDNDVCRAIEPCEDKWPIIEVYAYNDKKIESLYNDRSMLSNNSITNRRILRIYHVHGIAHKDENYPPPLQPLIFSENSYLEYQSTLLSWSQRCIAEVMQNNNLLCVGFSGKDANFRYLARIMNMLNKNVLSGSFTKKNVWITHIFQKRFLKASKNGNPYAFACLEMLTDSTTRYFKKHFGTNILWSEDYDMIAKKLAELYKKQKTS